jgi:cytochrome d ubiquinol oxidase subunit II
MESVWFAVIVFVLTVYTMLDGFDLGVGLLHPWAARTEPERRTVLASIGPVWDGNEVWLIAFGGLLFLAFPRVYAAGFSGFYLPLMMVLWLLIGRGIAIEWRHGLDDPMWKAPLDLLFFACSGLLALLFGLAVGNVVRGVPLDPQGYYQGLFAWMLNPYALLIGALSLTLLALHGANWLALKTEGTLQQRARGIARRLLRVLTAVLALATLATFGVRAGMLHNYRAAPALLVVPLLVAGTVAALWLYRSRDHDLGAFACSSGLIAGLAAATAIGLHPYLLPSEPHPERGLTIASAASNSHSLAVGLLWLSFGLTVVVSHMLFVYALFRGKVAEGGQEPLDTEYI